MPELPEVETVIRGMEPYFDGARIAAVRVNRPDLRIPFPLDLAERLEGARVEGLRRRSKYILIDTDRADVMLLHLGMSGKVSLYGAGSECPVRGKHDHLEIDLEGGAALVFTDPRRFGMVTLFKKTDEEAHSLLAHIGPEPLSNHFSADSLKNALEGRKTPIKAALLDQKTVAGLGNIYVCEALFRAGINPKRQAANIAADRVVVLKQHICDVLRDAISSGGSTLRDYVGVSGDLGYFQHSFDVYGREGEPCRREGCGGTVTRIVQSGRSTFYCPQCQR